MFTERQIQPVIMNQVLYNYNKSRRLKERKKSHLKGPVSIHCISAAVCVYHDFLVYPPLETTHTDYYRTIFLSIPGHFKE